MPSSPVSPSEYRALAEFRHQLLRFLRFSEQAARRTGLAPQQHQLLLAVRGMPAGTAATVGTLAQRLQRRHHSTVGLVDRLEARGWVRRARERADRREVTVRLTRRGETVLARLALAHRTEIRSLAPHLARALRDVIRGDDGVGAPR